MRIFQPFEDKLEEIERDMPSAILQMQLKIEHLERQNAKLSGQLVAILDVIQKVSEINIGINKKTFKTLLDTQKETLKTSLDCQESTLKALAKWLGE